MTNLNMLNQNSFSRWPFISHVARLSKDIFKASIFSFVMTLVFLLLSLSSNEPAFVANQYTSGSDDLTYLENIKEASLLNNPTLADLSVILSRQAEHAPAYPYILFLFFKVAPLSIFSAVFFNFFILYFVYLLMISSMPPVAGGLSPWKLLFFTPGLVFVACHAYKDLIILFLTLLSINAFSRKWYLVAIFFSCLTGYLRPFNWALIFLAYTLSKRFWFAVSLVLLLLLVGSYIYPGFSFEALESNISISHETALRDMESYGSTYQPTGNMAIDYLWGMMRFILLPLPWSISWDSRPLFLSILEMFQAIIIWFAVISALLKPKFILAIFKKNAAIFWYALIQASVYAVLYFGNAQPRYRVFIFVLTSFILVSMLSLWGSKSNKSRTF